ncbi:hypothetical protein HAX54_037010 [Datura stramonium]|uniref:Uncharacterized protein n=1 Tax=Datura stramonium TaxID=4076 RepID=A0ABS8VLK2_DATST|nr:hypothetical protein [Datura stramonium]
MKIKNGVQRKILAKQHREAQRMAWRDVQALELHGLIRCKEEMGARSPAVHRNRAHGAAHRGTPKPSKEKGVASSSHDSKRSRRANEEEHDDVSKGEKGPKVWVWGSLDPISARAFMVQSFLSMSTTLIDNMLSHLYGMQMLQLKMNEVTEEQLQQLNMDHPLSEHSRAFCRIGPRFEHPLDDDMATDEEMSRVDSDIESNDD